MPITKCFFLFALVLLLAVAARASDVESNVDVALIVSYGFDLLSSIGDPVRLFESIFGLVQIIAGEQSDGGDGRESIDAALSTISNRLDEISAEIQDFREQLFDELRRHKSVYEATAKLDEFFKIKEKIDGYYEKFNNLHDSSRGGTYLNSTREIFVEQIRKVGHNGVAGLLEEMHALVRTDRWSSSAFNLLSDGTMTSTLACSRGRPPQLIIYNIYLALCATELKGVTLEMYAITEDMKKAGVNSSGEIDDIKEAFAGRLNRTKISVRRAMEKASREYWSCNQPEPEEGTTFMQFGPFIQMAIEREERMYRQHPRTSGYLHWDKCKGGCEEHTSSYINDPGQYGCGHRLRNCRTFDSSVDICYAKAATWRRYEYAVGNNDNVYGYNGNEKCSGTVASLAKYFNLNLFECEICVCTCEELHAPDHFIDLGEVTSDVENNEVIVGLRFKRIYGLLYMEAKTAKLLPSGTIDPKTASWTENPLTEDKVRELVEGVHHVRLSWSNRSFALDDVELDNDYALTGVKFVYEGGLVKVAARGNAYDFKRGTLDAEDAIWSISGESKSLEDYGQLSVEELDVPTDHSENRVDSVAGQYVNLTTSSMRSDLGQSVVPFVDTLPVVPRQLIPLAGFGLIHKGGRKSAGYLALELLGYDLKPHVL